MKILYFPRIGNEESIKFYTFLDTTPSDTTHSPQQLSPATICFIASVWIREKYENFILVSSYWKRGKHKILYFPRFQYEETMSLFKMSGSISIFKASISMFKKYTKYINIFKKYINLWDTSSTPLRLQNMKTKMLPLRSQWNNMMTITNEFSLKSASCSFQLPTETL